MQKSDTDSYNYSTIEDSAASTESTLRYCLWKKGTQFTYDIPDGLIEGDCVEVKGRLTGKRVVMELSGAPRNTDDSDRLVPLRIRFSRGGHYKVHSDHLGRDKYRRGKFKWDFQADSAFKLQIRILQLVYDIRLNDQELIKFDHGQLHSEIHMLCLDGEADFSAVEFIDIEDIGQPSTIDELMVDTSSENETGQIFSPMTESVAVNASPQSPNAASPKSPATSKAKAESPPSKRRRDSSKESKGSVSSKEPSTGGHKETRGAPANSDDGASSTKNPPSSMMRKDRHDADRKERPTSPKTERRHHDGRYTHRPSTRAASKSDAKSNDTGRPDAVISGRPDVPSVQERQPTSKKHREHEEKNSLADDLPSNSQNHALALSQPSSRRRDPMDVDNDLTPSQTRMRTRASKTSSSSEAPETASNHRPADDFSRQEQPRVHKQRSSDHQSKEPDVQAAAHKQPDHSRRVDRPQAQLTTERQQSRDTHDKKDGLKQKKQSPSRTSSSSDAPEAAQKFGRDENDHKRQPRHVKRQQSQEDDEEQKRERESQNSRHKSSNLQSQRHEEKSREKQKRERRQHQPDDDQLDANKSAKTQGSVQDSAMQPERIEKESSGKKRSSSNSSKSDLTTAPQSTKHSSAQQQLASSSKRSGSDVTPPLSPQDSAVRSTEASRRKGHRGDEKRAAMDGVYRVIPVTPVTPQAVQKQKHGSQLEKQHIIGNEEKKSVADPGLKFSLNDEDLVNLSVIMAEENLAKSQRSPKDFNTHPALPFGVELSTSSSSEFDDNLIKEEAIVRANSNAVSARPPTSAVSNEPLSDAKGAGAKEGSGITGSLGNAEAPAAAEVPSSRQYMYYGAGEAAAAVVEASLPAAADEVAPIALSETLNESRQEASLSYAESAGDTSKELARDAANIAMVGSPIFADNSPLNIREGPLRGRARSDHQQQQQQPQQQKQSQEHQDPLVKETVAVAPAGEQVYSKVYDTIDVEHRKQQLSVAKAPEPEPFVAHLPEPLRCGRRIIVCGQLTDESNGLATVSLKSRNTAAIASASGGAQTPEQSGEEEFQVKLEIREDKRSAQLTCRQFNGKVWTEERKAETRKSLPQDSSDGSFIIELHTTSTGFTVRFEDALCIQPHSLPFSNFTHLVLDGNSDYQSVDFPEELELPYIEEFPQSLELISQIVVKLQTTTSPPTTQVIFGFDHGAAMLCVLDLAKQTVSIGRTVPETGGFLCETKVGRVPELKALKTILLRIDASSVLVLLEGKPIVSYSLLNRKLYITSFFVDGGFTLKDVSWKEKRAPKFTPLPASFQVGRVIRVTGRLPVVAGSGAQEDSQSSSPCHCCISLVQCSRDPAAVAPDAASPSVASSTAASPTPASVIGFCLRCEPRRLPTLSCSTLATSSVSLPMPPLESGQQFEACVLYRLNGFELLQLGDSQPRRHHQHLRRSSLQQQQHNLPQQQPQQQPMLLPHQVEPQRLSHVMLTGGAIYYEVEFPEQLALPYLNRFPVSLKESRFVTAEIADSGRSVFQTQQRTTTISFALCCGPGDSSLKPLVCEFNLAQGYASVAWADSAGQLRDEETRKFDPRLTNDVEVVALQATDSEYILSCNETAVLRYGVRHDLSEIHYIMIDGDACITSVKFEGKAASLGCCIN